MFFQAGSRQLFRNLANWRNDRIQNDIREHLEREFAQAGVDVLTLAALLGHETVQMTSRYVHPSDQHKGDAVKKLETYNAEMVFKYAESVSGSLQKPLQ